MGYWLAICARVCCDFSDCFRGDLSGVETCYDSGIERFWFAIRLWLGVGTLSVCRSRLSGWT